MTKEYAVSRKGQNRQPIAVECQKRWIAFEDHRLKSERRLFLEELNRTTDPQKRHELNSALKENQLETLKLQQGVVNSSLRRHLATIEKSTAAGVNAEVEERIAEQETFSENINLCVQRTGKASNRQISGYAAMFWSDSVDMGGWIEQLAPNCFEEALKISDVRCLFNHDPNFVLGRSTNKSLRLYQDKAGLYFFCDLNADDSTAVAIHARVLRGDVCQCSFCFTLAAGGVKWKLAEKPGELDRRIITKIEQLYDVGPVTYPAYPDTTVVAYNSAFTSERYRADGEREKRLSELEKRLARKRGLPFYLQKQRIS